MGGNTQERRSRWRCVALAGALAAAGLSTAAGAQPQVHSVIVANDFFSPRILEIEVGDTVQWTNASGLHNVFSCVPQQLGCDTTATETFVSGPPDLPIWTYSYTFQLPGSNPYICQSHAPFMTGLVEVSAAPVPALSGSGLIALTLLLLVASTAVLFRSAPVGGVGPAVR